jgi:hypothetical protein
MLYIDIHGRSVRDEFREGLMLCFIVERLDEPTEVVGDKWHKRRAVLGRNFAIIAEPL